MRPPASKSAINCGFCALVLGGTALLLREPLLIPAIGGTIYMVMTAPDHEASSPKNVVISHGLGAVIGWVMLGLFGLHGVPGGIAMELSWPRVAAVAASLAATNGVTRAVKCAHPPAGATTMIVSIGAMPLAHHILDFELAAIVVVGYGLAVHNIAGVEYPLWRRVRESA